MLIGVGECVGTIFESIVDVLAIIAFCNDRGELGVKEAWGGNKMQMVFDEERALPMCISSPNWEKW